MNWLCRFSAQIWILVIYSLFLETSIFTNPGFNDWLEAPQRFKQLRETSRKNAYLDIVPTSLPGAQSDQKSKKVNDQNGHDYFYDGPALDRPKKEK